MANLGLKMRMTASDKISKVNKRVGLSFKAMKVGAMKANRSFKILQGRSEKLKKSLSKTGGKMKSIGGSMSTFITAPVIGLGAAILKTSSSFQAGMNKVQALTRESSPTTKNMMNMNALARQLGRDTQFSATQAADAMAFYGQAGFKANQILKAVPATLNLAAASGTDLAESADIASNIMGGFGLRAKDMGRIVDVLALTTASGNTNLIQMGEALKNAAPVAKQYGLTIEQTSAIVAKLGDSGIQASAAGTSMKRMFLQIAAGGAPVNKLLEKLGVKRIDPITKKMRPMNVVLKEMAAGFKKLNATDGTKLAVLKKVFGQKAIASAAILLDVTKKLDPTTGKYVDTLGALETKLNNANGTAKKMAKVMQQGLPGALKRLTSATEDMLLSFGFKGGFASVGEAVIEKLTSLVKWFSGLSKGTMKVIGVTAGLLALIGPLLVVLGAVVVMMPGLVTAYNLWAASTIGMTVASAGLSATLLPMLGFAAAFAAMGISVYLAWDPVKGLLNDLFTNPLQEMKDMVDAASTLVGFGSIFGMNTEDVDAELRRKGFTGSGVGGAKGPAKGARQATKKSNEQKSREGQSKIAVQFSNIPKGTKVETDDLADVLSEVSLGMMGAF